MSTPTAPIPPTAEATAAARAALVQCDIILESDVLSLVRSFLSVGGQPRDAIRALSESYTGYGDLCNLLFEWITAVDTEHSSMLTDALTNFVSDRFDPHKADTLFSSKTTTPLWLEHMIASAEWTPTLHQLSLRYPHCLILNFAVRQIQENKRQKHSANKQMSLDEFASATNSAIVRAVNALSGAAANNEEKTSLSREEQYRSAVGDVTALALQSEWAYLYVQQRLFSLTTAISNPSASAFVSKLSGHITLAAANTHTQSQLAIVTYDALVTELLPKYFDMFQIGYRIVQSDPRVLQHNHALLVSRATLDTRDINILYQYYSASDPPPLYHLQSSVLVTAIIHSLFHIPPTTTTVEPLVSPQQAHKYIYLLAYASAVVDRRHIRHTASSSSLLSSVVDKTAIEGVTAALNRLHSVASSKQWSIRPHGAIMTIRSLLHDPIVSQCALYWIHIHLSDAAYYETASHSLCTPLFLTLLGTIATIQSQQRHLVYEIIHSAFILAIPMESLHIIAYRKTLLQLIVHLIHCNLLNKSFTLILNNIHTMDHSLIRHFLLHLLTSTTQPFTAIYLYALCTLLSQPQCIAAVKVIMQSLYSAMKERKSVYDKRKRLLADSGGGDRRAKRARKKNASSSAEEAEVLTPSAAAALPPPPPPIQPLPLPEVKVTTRPFLTSDVSEQSEADGVKSFGHYLIDLREVLAEAAPDMTTPLLLNNETIDMDLDDDMSISEPNDVIKLSDNDSSLDNINTVPRRVTHDDLVKQIDLLLSALTKSTLLT